MPLLNKRLLRDTVTKHKHEVQTATKQGLQGLFRETLNRIETGKFKSGRGLPVGKASLAPFGKEESEKVPFLQKMFELLGYKLHENLEFEFSIQGRSILGEFIPPSPLKGGEKASFEGGLEDVQVAIEWKGIDTKNLDKGKAGETPVSQMWDYMGKVGAEIGIIGNFLEFRIYTLKTKQTEYQDYFLRELVNQDEKLDEFIFLFKKQTLLKSKNGDQGIASTKGTCLLLDLIDKSEIEQEQITKRFYNDYKQRRTNLFEHLVENNSENKHNFIVRDYQDRDAKSVEQIILDGWTDSVFIDIEKDLIYESAKKSSFPALKNPEIKKLVCAKDQEIVGYLVLDIKDDQLAFVGDFYVDRNHRKQGVGRILFTEGLIFLRENGFKSLKLYLDDDNLPARKFYEKVGFIPEEASKYEWTDASGKVVATNNEHLMFLDLAKVSLKKELNNKLLLLEKSQPQLRNYQDLEKDPTIFPLPQLKKFKNENKELWFYGVVHTFNYPDKMLDEIEKCFNDLQPDLVILEGSTKINKLTQEYKRYFLETDLEELVSQKGEYGFSLKLALEKNISVFCPEPEFYEQAIFLESFFTKEQISSAFILEILDQDLAKNFSRESAEKIIKSEMEWQKNKLNSLNNWQNFDFSYENFLASFRKITNRNFWECDLDYINNLVSPINWGADWNIYNELSKKDGEFRDLFILGKLKEKVSKYNKILIIYGGHHLYTLEPELEKMCKSGNSELAGERAFDWEKEFGELLSIPPSLTPPQAGEEKVTPLKGSKTESLGVLNTKYSWDKIHTLPVNKKLVERAKEMVKNMTKAEQLFWFNFLKSNKTGFKWVKQRIIDNYIVDFYCHRLGLVVEIDGDTHAEREEYDEIRTKFLNNFGIKVIRYSNDEVYTNQTGIFEDLQIQIKKRYEEVAKYNPIPPSTSLTPPQAGESLAKSK